MPRAPITSHLNLKWTVHDTDIIRRMIERGRTPYAIALWFTRNGKPCSTDEIVQIRDDMGASIGRAG